MPRCYMVKKQSNKYQQAKGDYWDERAATTVTTNTTAAPGPSPESPTEACVAPSYYAPPSKQSRYGKELDESPKGEEVVTEQDGGIPIFRIRSPEETEAAHDLLSLSQSLPPLPAPGVVTIHHTFPTGETPPSPTRSYRPLSPDMSTRSDSTNGSPHLHVQQLPPEEARTKCDHLQQHPQAEYTDQNYPPASPIPVSIPNYPPPIVYVVEVPTVTTSPISEFSECSSDTENHPNHLNRQDKANQGGCIQSFNTNNDQDILILPLSAVSQNHPPVNFRPLPTVPLVVPTQKTSVIVSPTKAKPPPVRQQSVITSTAAQLNIPDRRTRRNCKPKKSCNNNECSTVEQEQKKLGRRRGNAENEPSNKTKFYKVVPGDTENRSRLEADEEYPKSNRYVCNECGKQYATSSNLSRHRQTHRSLDSQAAKKCTSCGKAYVSMPALAMHQLTHKLGHTCGVCGKQFSRPWLLQGHLRSHTGEKPYGCAHCGKAFADRSNLRAHMQTHSADKNFRCEKCKKTFALKSYLNKHQESACWDFSKEYDLDDPNDPVAVNVRQILGTPAPN